MADPEISRFPRLVRHDAALKVGLGSADRGIVVVQFDAELAWRVDRGVIDLDLVGLGIRAYDEKPYDPARSDITYSPRAAPIPEDATG